MEKYNHKDIEKKWQEKWEEEGIYKTQADSSKPKQYILDMFPYPSGEGLHVGHPRGYIATDVYSRMKRMQGFNILHPMGWDAFGLPAENFAIKNKINPRVAVEKNIARFKEQLSLIGLDYDWSHEVDTTDPKFYKWTQWIFLQMFKKGLAYESHEPINWCPSCQTGLANEDVNADSTCERCGTVVEKKPMRQWVLKITDYADRMLLDLDKLPKWPEGVKEAQRNWIGRSEGSEIEFQLKIEDGDKIVKVFTTRADTLFGVTYIVLAPEHPIIQESILTFTSGVTNKSEIDKYITETKKKSELDRQQSKEKTGVEIKGIKAINPANGEEVSVWVADYVLAGYGTGAVMAVPAHDERDFEFAKKYNLPIKQVVAPYFFDKNNPPKEGKENTKRTIIHAILLNEKEDKFIALRHKTQPWLTPITGGIDDGEDIISAAEREIKEETGYQNLELIKQMPYLMWAEFYAAHKDLNRSVHSHALVFKIKNDVREPLSDEEKEKHEVVWLPISELKTLNPVSELSEILRWFENNTQIYTEYGKLINSGPFDGLTSEDVKKKIIEKVGGKMVSTYKIKDWIFSRQRYWGEPIPLIHCEKCGVVPVPEKDLPVLLPEVENYEPAGTGESPLANIADWVNVKCPSCGGNGKRETNTMPQWAGSSWYYLRYIDPENSEALIDLKKEKEWMPVDVYVGGDHATRHLIYARFWHKFLFDIGAVSTEEPFPRLEFLGFILAEDGRKMSKRWKNVVNPDEMVERFGADSFRLYEMFIGPFESTVPWSTDGLVGTSRFLEKVWRLKDKIDKEKKTCRTDNLVEKTIKGVEEDIENFKFNTAVSKMMILVNALEKEEKVTERTYKILLQLLSPFAPHITEELWHEMGNTSASSGQEAKSIHLSDWPKYDESKIVDNEFELVLQVNGKKRGSIVLANDISEDEIKKIALEDESVKRNIEGKEIVRVVVVPKKLINIVVK
ncbi:MAG TPA: leucine--tRNA ligase [Candidatus Paceibacterota bacterium]|nr:leucine--tRNA ligase [Candidatus Paceibacterota bacterium]